VGGLVIAGVAAVFLTQNKPAPHHQVAIVNPEAVAPVGPAVAASAPAAAAPKEEPAKPAPAKMTIRIVSQPAGAQLWLGDESAPRGEVKAHVRAEMTRQ